MTRRPLLVLVPVIMIAVPAAAAPPQLDQGSPAVKEVVARSQELAAAIRTRDDAKLKMILADELMVMTARGLVTKDVWLEGARRLEILTIEVKEARGAVYGDTAVVWSRNAYTAKVPAADPTAAPTDVSATNWLTDVYVKRDGRWQLVSRQSTPVAK
jgi:hypothetical protein